ncbi:MAG: CDF family Co(II)/Ni(II) efflux transporter DmeF [bacterium]
MGHLTDIRKWEHSHNFSEGKKEAEGRLLAVVLLTFFTMVIEIVAGLVFNSMAVFADGWHMGTHMSALSISLFAFILARRFAEDKRFTFGTYKIEALGAYTSAIFLGAVAFFVLFTSLERLMHPRVIGYRGALLVAVVGLVVNAFSAIILHYGMKGGTTNYEAPPPSPRACSSDINLRAAFLHVVADALTSILAITGLLSAMLFHWNWMDPFVGIVGSYLIFRWTYGLLQDSTRILLDREMDSHLISMIRREIESDGDSRISDLHLLKVAQDKYALIMSIVAHNPSAIEEYKKKLKKFSELAHITIEIHNCPGKIPVF